MLTGKYQGGVPADSRGNVKGYEWLQSSLTDAHRVAAVARLSKISNDLGVPLAQMALAWCLKNPNVSSVITGASRASQVHENMKALAVVPQLTTDVMALIEGALVQQ
jgi:aryl-alcohol dehydrogenase-like predicted oxidoreductase